MTDGTTTWSYTYNADGLRTKRTNGSTTYEYVYYDGLLQYMEYNGQPAYFTHAPDGTPMGIVYGGYHYYYATNLQGDVVAILSEVGSIVVEYSYDAWGNLLSTTGALADYIGKVNPLRYRGYVYDAETGLYYLQSRYYDPEIGRFINADGYASTGQGFVGNNMFAYCNNSPVTLLDGSGNRPVVGVSPYKQTETEQAQAFAYMRECPYYEAPTTELPYNTEEEAAAAFIKEIWNSSHYIGHEFSGEIIANTANGNTTYGYTMPRLGTPHACTPRTYAPKGTSIVAVVHTHPRTNEFTGEDLNYGINYCVNVYMSGPNHTLQKYSWRTGAFWSSTYTISPNTITSVQKARLVSICRTSWINHFDTCRMGCNSNAWPCT